MSPNERDECFVGKLINVPRLKTKLAVFSLFFLLLHELKGYLMIFTLA